VGYWKIHNSLETLDQQTTNIVLIFAALILSIATLIGFLLNSILVRFILNPVYMLKNAMKNIQGSDGASNLKDGGLKNVGLKDVGLNAGSSKAGDSKIGGSNAGSLVPHQKLDEMVKAFDELPDDLIHHQASDNEISALAFSFRQMLFALKRAYIGISTDALTGMNNRRKIDEALEDEAIRSQRYESTYSIIMLDIDRFKRVNDIYGHLAGDDVLKKIAGILQKSFRKTDVPCRWGGEEFMVLLPLQNSKGACMVAEKIRAKIESTKFPVVGNITASFGVAECEPGDTPSDIIKRADRALYKAKEMGRNRVEVGRA
jgi:diguanylate cyclase (GGDEF)-like protein